MRASLPRHFWRQVEGAIALPVHLLLPIIKARLQFETQLMHQIGSLFIVTLEGKKRSLNVKSG